MPYETTPHCVTRTWRETSQYETSRPDVVCSSVQPNPNTPTDWFTDPERRANQCETVTRATDSSLTSTYRSIDPTGLVAYPPSSTPQQRSKRKKLGYELITKRRPETSFVPWWWRQVAQSSSSVRSVNW